MERQVAEEFSGGLKTPGLVACRAALVTARLLVEGLEHVLSFNCDERKRLSLEATRTEIRNKALEEAAKECGKNALDSRSPCRHRIHFNCHASCHAVDAAAIRVLKVEFGKAVQRRDKKRREREGL
jgi:hypothetical protein